MKIEKDKFNALSEKDQNLQLLRVRKIRVYLHSRPILVEELLRRQLSGIMDKI